MNDKWKKATSLSMIVVIVSFLGFCVENVSRICSKGILDNRNMHLPFLLGYGLAIVALFAIFGTPQKPRFFRRSMTFSRSWMGVAYYFAAASLCVMVGEIALGEFVEKTAGIIWWDYTNIPLHITRYTSIPTTLCFATLITVFMGCFFMPLYDFLIRKASVGLAILTFTLLAALTVDFLVSAAAMYRTGELLSIWQVDLWAEQPRLQVFSHSHGV